jgi:hypothetical protein
VASRLSSTSGAARGDRREPDVARVVQFSPRERGLASPANDNVRPTDRHILRLVGSVVMLAVMAAGGIYFYLS